MYYELYLDVLFLVNFIMDFLMISYVKKTLKIPYSWGRTILGALLGALGSCLLVFGYKIPWFFRFMMSYIGISMAMVRFGFPKTKWKGMVKRYFVLLLYSFLLGGIIFFLQYKWTLSLVKSLAAAGILSFLLLEILQKIKQYGNHIFEVKLLVEGETIKLKGLYDTGNHLVCPWNGKEVHVVDETCLNKYVGKEHQEEGLSLFPIPFSSVGENQGVMMAVQIDAMSIEGEEGRITVKNKPVIGLGSKKLFQNRPYQIILHSKSFQ